MFLSTIRKKICTSFLVFVVLISQSTILFADTQKFKTSVVNFQQEEEPAIPDDNHNEEIPDPNILAAFKCCYFYSQEKEVN